MQRQHLARLGSATAAALARTSNHRLAYRCLPSHRRYAANVAPPIPDKLAEGEHGGAKGRTGGGEPLESSKNPPPRPAVENATVPGKGGRDSLSKEQKREVDEHNEDFFAKHDRAQPAARDKVDKSFWEGGEGGRS